MIDDPLNRTKVRRGSDLPQAKLDEHLVREILRLVEYREGLKKHVAGLTNQHIADAYGVHRRTIDRITAGEHWTHVTAEPTRTAA